MKIAIQGIKGSFHHITANQYFDDNITLNECFSFDIMPLLLVNKKVDYLVMAIENQSLKDIKEVWSHSMVINQCHAFLRKFPHIKLIEESDTAEVARLIQKKQLKGIAAIASRKAAEIYNLKIIESNIQTNKENYTRFFILNKEPKQVTDSNKVSLKFITKHQQGSLVEVLHVFVKYQLNLSKIQSLPIIDNPWEYSFFYRCNF